MLEVCLLSKVFGVAGFRKQFRIDADPGGLSNQLLNCMLCTNQGRQIFFLKYQIFWMSKNFDILWKFTVMVLCKIVMVCNKVFSAIYSVKDYFLQEFSTC